MALVEDPDFNIMQQLHDLFAIDDDDDENTLTINCP